LSAEFTDGSQSVFLAGPAAWIYGRRAAGAQPFQIVTETERIHSPTINQNSPRRDKVIVARTNTSKRKVITRQSQFNRRKPSTNSVAVQLNPGFPERDPNARV